jgi:sugar-specific transcriptional regulator TrmB
MVSDDSKPKLYYAVEPEDLLSRIQSDFMYSIQNLREELIKLKGGSRDKNLFTFRGYMPLVEKLRQVLEEAHTDTAVLLGAPEIKALKAEIVKASERTKNFVCMTYHSISQHCVNGIRVCHTAPEPWVVESERGTERWVAFVERDSQAVFGFVSEVEPDAIVSYWTRNPSVVFSQYELLMCSYRVMQNSSLNGGERYVVKVPH